MTRSTSNEDYFAMMRRLIAALVRRVADADEPELAEMVAMRDELEAAIAQAIDGQRMMGKSWQAIATATGTTRQAAFQRYGRSKQSNERMSA